MPDDKRIAVLGAGMHPWGKWGRPFVEYGMAAVRDALADAGLTWRDIQFVSGADTIRNGYPGFVAGATFAQALGWTGARVSSCYAACASGAAAIGNARAQILAGLCDVALVVGADTTPKGFFAPVGGGERKDDPDWLRFHLMGATNPTYFALYARRRMDRFGATEEDFAQVKVKNARHGRGQPLRPLPGRSHRRRGPGLTHGGRSAPPARDLRHLGRRRRAGAHHHGVRPPPRPAARSPLVTINAVSTVTPSFPNTVIEMPNFSTDSAVAFGADADTGAGLPALHHLGRLRRSGHRARGPGPGRGLRPLGRPRAGLVRGHRPVRRRRGREAAARRRDLARGPGARQPLGRPVLLRRGHPGPGHRPGVRVGLAAAGHRPGAPGRGGPGGRHGQSGPVRARIVGPAHPLSPAGVLAPGCRRNFRISGLETAGFGVLLAATAICAGPT